MLRGMSYSSSAEELREHVRIQVQIGFHDAEAIVEETASMFEVEEEVVEPIVAEYLAALEQEEWPEVTDCDRLDAAFAALDARGIRARQHFACCNTCGHSELTEDIHLARELGATIDGYAFYHRQDAEAAVASGLLRVRYSAIGGREADEALGQRIVAALREHGLTPTWSGDLFETIELRGFVWQRGDWPAEEDDEAAWTAEDALREWMAHLREKTTADLAGALGSLYMDRLVEFGLVDVARTWARAHSRSIVSPAPRCLALARLAGRLGSAELALEAIACVPFGRCGLLVEVLLSVDLGDPAVRRAARARALAARPDLHGIAGVAWYLARSSEEDPGLLAQVLQRLDRPERSTILDELSPRTAIAAALWTIHHRCGETDAAAVMRARVVAALADSPHWLAGFATNAIKVAAEACGDVALAGRFADRPLPGSVAEAEAELARIRAGHDEGLYTHHEVGSVEHDLLLVKLRDGDRDANVRELSAYARSLRDEVAGIGAEVMADVERVRDGGAPLAAGPDDSWFTPEGERRLQRYIDTWTAAPDRPARRDAAYRGRKILAAAVAFAGRGDVARANELIALVLAVDERPVVDERAAIVALLAVDELERAVEYAEATSPGCEAIAPLAVGLAQAGRTEEALAWIHKAFMYGWERSRVVALAPAVLAVAEDPRAAAAAMLACRDEANASLDELLPAAWRA